MIFNSYIAFSFHGKTLNNHVFHKAKLERWEVSLNQANMFRGYKAFITMIHYAELG